MSDYQLIEDGSLEYLLNLEEKTATVRCEKNSNALLEGEVIIPSFITYKEVKYPVTYIPFLAFEGCCNLKKITIPNTIDRLLRSTFDSCRNLECVEIPASVKTFLPNIFYGCENLQKIIFENLKESNSNTDGFYLNEEVFFGCNPEVIIEDRTTGKEFRLNELTNKKHGK